MDKIIAAAGGLVLGIYNAVRNLWQGKTRVSVEVKQQSFGAGFGKPQSAFSVEVSNCSNFPVNIVQVILEFEDLGSVPIEFSESIQNGSDMESRPLPRRLDSNDSVTLIGSVEQSDIGNSVPKVVVVKMATGKSIRKTLNKAGKSLLFILLSAVFMAIVAVMCLPMLFEFHSISKTRERFLSEAAVARQAMNRSVNRPSENEIINPSYLRHYNLSLDDYRDSQGYFSPTGKHWVKWSIETKAASILMWLEKKPPSAIELRSMIHRIDEYYRSNDINTPLIDVVYGLASENEAK